MFISDPIFKFHNLFYKQVALLISYRSAQTSENILQNRNQRQITVHEFQSILYENAYFLTKQER